MGVLKKILVFLVVVVAVLALVGLFLPATAHVERAAVIEAPPAMVFALVNDFHNFNRWSPWFDRDPDAEYLFEGPARGVGAKMSWRSEKPDVGSGSQEITASEPDRRVEVLLDFGDQGTADSYYTLEPEGESSTRLTWGFDTDLGMNPVGRYFGLMFDSMIGPDYELGLARLKELAESLPQADWTDLDIEVVDVDAEPLVYTVVTTTPEDDVIAAELGQAYGRVLAFIASHGLEQAGPPVAVIDEHTATTYRFGAGIPVAAAPEVEIPEDSPVKLGESHGGRAVRAVHVGPYSTLVETHGKIDAYMAAHGLEASGRPWETYVSDPGEVPEDELITHIYYPVK